MVDMNQFFNSTFLKNNQLQSRGLRDYLIAWVDNSQVNLDDENARFLKAITTYIVRQFKKRRKGGVPVGQLERFCLPEDKKVNLFDVLAAMVVSIMRKRGLRESQARTQNDNFDLLNEAFNKTPKFKPNKEV